MNILTYPKKILFTLHLEQKNLLFQLLNVNMDLGDEFFEKSYEKLEDIKKETSEVIEWATENYKNKLFIANNKPLSSARIKANAAYRKFMDISSDDETQSELQLSDDTIIIGKLNCVEKKLELAEMVWKTALEQMSEITKSMKYSNDKITSALLPKFPLNNVEELKRFERICQCFPEVIDENLKNVFDFHNQPLRDYVIATMSKILTIECGAACSWTGFDGFQLQNTELMNLLLSELRFNFIFNQVYMYI